MGRPKHHGFCKLLIRVKLFQPNWLADARAWDCQENILSTRHEQLNHLLVKNRNPQDTRRNNWSILDLFQMLQPERLGYPINHYNRKTGKIRTDHVWSCPVITEARINDGSFLGLSWLCFERVDKLTVPGSLQTYVPKLSFCEHIYWWYGRFKKIPSGLSRQRCTGKPCQRFHWFGRRRHCFITSSCSTRAKSYWDRNLWLGTKSLSTKSMKNWESGYRE